jgi:hypothetical protein
VNSVTPDEPRRAPIRWRVATVRDARTESLTARTLVVENMAAGSAPAGPVPPFRSQAEPARPCLVGVHSGSLPEWRPHTRDQNQAILDRRSLTGEFWRLP